MRSLDTSREEWSAEQGDVSNANLFHRLEARQCALSISFSPAKGQIQPSRAEMNVCTYVNLTDMVVHAVKTNERDDKKFSSLHGLIRTANSTHNVELRCFVKLK